MSLNAWQQHPRGLVVNMVVWQAIVYCLRTSTSTQSRNRTICLLMTGAAECAIGAGQKKRRDLCCMFLRQGMHGRPTYGL